MIVAARKGQALLAYLALRRGQTQPRNKLATLLWGDASERQARNSLRQTLFSIRRALADVPGSLRSDGDVLMLNPDVVWVDALAFEEAAHDGTPAGLKHAAALYTGDLLESVNLREPGFEEWLVVERERYRELAFGVLTRLLKSQAEHGDIESAIQVAGRLLALDPLQEPVHRALIRLYVQQGRRGAAQRQCQICAEIVRRELGVDVEPETKRLFQEIVHDQPKRGGRQGFWPGTLRESRDPGRPSVLVVEDERALRRVLQRFLQGAGYEVVMAENGADALLQLGRRRFDVVLSDVSMPTLDGLQLLDVMRQKKIGTPTILMTTMPDSDLAARGLELGAADCLGKPVHKDVLLARVRRILRRTGRSVP